ncbi:MAG: DEAD/DEAH box helicase [Treponemataceae bacterium]|nr:DEAD/DEAH box helicase [Treponemataceae bacterium]
MQDNSANSSPGTKKPADTAQLPISPHLPEIVDNLKRSESRFLILTAETAAGKSTAVPPALLDAFPGKILMLEPRRLAAVAVASRVAELLGEECGETAGYRLHLDSFISKKTRFEVMTEAILVRMLQEDASLEGVSVVILDEFHERSLWTDLSLAFLKDTMQLRDDLYVLIMSATIDTEKLSAFLGCPHLHIAGRQYPVEIEYRAPEHKDICEDVTEAVKAIPEDQNILAFLPGIKELRRTEELLTTFAKKTDSELFILHSSVPVQEQRKVLSPARPGKRRIILSSAVAETSVTVPGITYVVDSGLSRINRLNTATGMNHLVTESESLFSAEQRAGRAGRTAKGNCIRLWREQDIRVRNAPLQIMCTELIQLVLECALWGVHSPEGLSWLDPPPLSAWKAAASFLQLTGCIDKGGLITVKGKLVLKAGVHPRIACIALESLKGNDQAIKYAAKYGLSLPKGAPEDLQRRERQRLENELARRIQTYRQANAAEKVTGQGKSPLPVAEGEAGLPGILCLLAGFPDRAAYSLGEGKYIFPSGRQASLLDSDKKLLSPSFPQWIIAIEADAGDREGRIYSFEIIPQEPSSSPWKEKSQQKQTELTEAFSVWLEARTEARVSVAFVDKQHSKLKKMETVFFGKIPLKTKVLPASAEDATAAWCSLALEEGIRALPWNDACSRFLARADFFRRHSKGSGGPKAESRPETEESWAETEEIRPETEESRPDSEESWAETERSTVGSTKTYKSPQNLEESLALSVKEWLPPFISAGTRLTPEDLLSALRWKLDGDTVDKNVPERLKLSNGRNCKVTYETRDSRKGASPVIEIIIQQLFGCFTTPKIMGEPVLLKLLSPARRPLQVTSDLENFWKNTWPEICKEMKGRYPKHNWDYTKVQD